MDALVSLTSFSESVEHTGTHEHFEMRTGGTIFEQTSCFQDLEFMNFFIRCAQIKHELSTRQTLCFCNYYAWEVMRSSSRCLQISDTPCQRLLAATVPEHRDGHQLTEATPEECMKESRKQWTQPEFDSTTEVRYKISTTEKWKWSAGWNTTQSFTLGEDVMDDTAFGALQNPAGGT